MGPTKYDFFEVIKGSSFSFKKVMSLIELDPYNAIKVGFEFGETEGFLFHGGLEDGIEVVAGNDGKGFEEVTGLHP